MQAQVAASLVALALLAACGSEPPASESAPSRTALSLAVGEADSAAPATAAVQAEFKPFEELSKDVRAQRQVVQAVEAVAPVSPPAVAMDAAETEPNNDVETAQQLTLPFTVKAHMDPVEKAVKEGDSDWFVFEVSRAAPGLLGVDVSALAGADLGLEVFREGLRGREILISVNNLGAGKAERIPNVCLVNGRYWVRVFQKPIKKKKVPFASTEAVYELTGTVSEAAAGQECEPNGDPLVARPIELPGVVSGVLNRIDDEDLYVLDLTRLSPLSFFRIELLPPMGAKVVFSVQNRARQEVFSLEASGGQKVLVPNLGLLSGYSEYFLSIKGAEKNAAVGTYQLTVSVDRLKERMELEPNASVELALRMPYDQPIQGWIVSDRDADWFKIEAPSDMPAEGQPMPLGRPVISVMLAGVAGTDLVMELLSEDGSQVEQILDVGGKGEGETLPNLPVPKGPKFLRVRSASGANSHEAYTVQMTLVATDGFEKEPNEVPETANPWSAGEEIRGYLPHLQDQDCFAIPAGADSLVLRAPDNAGLRVARVMASGETQVAELAKGKSATLPKEGAAYTLCVALREGAERATSKPYSLGGANAAP